MLDGSNAANAKSTEAVCGAQMLSMGSRVERFFGGRRSGGGSAMEEAERSKEGEREVEDEREMEEREGNWVLFSSFKISKFYKILHPIEFFDICIKY